jgi:hypothetical protein
MSKVHKNAAEIAKLEKLRGLLLDNFIHLCDTDQLTPTDRRTLAGLLKDNGMQLDPSAIPEHLRDKLSASLPVEEGLEEDAGI